MNRMISIFLITSLYFFVACTNDNKRVDEINSKDIDMESIWFDYQVSGEEGNDSITIKLQFRYDGEYGETIIVNKPAQVQLDGETIGSSFSGMTGEYYEVRKAISTFTGKHLISFINSTGKEYKEEFTFRPLVLTTKIPGTLERNDIIFQWDGLEKVEYVRVLLTDTAYASEGINRVDTITDGRIVIKKSDLYDLSNGPIHLELIREDIREVEDGTFTGGRISISYGLAREFILKD